ncbi:hypothetical protein ACFUYE_00695 [Micromonospora humida]|uniref:hypothetical protein n=1 Tax=Micromonospora humida TaxID=2809018 RepID=UPI00366EED39
MTPRHLTALTAAVLLLAGCGGDPEPAAAPTPTTTSAAPAPTTAAPAGDAYAQQACTTLAGAITAGTDRDPATMQIVADTAAQSTTTAIAAAGRALASRAELAAAAKGQSDEQRMTADLVATALGLSTACKAAGY